MTTVDELFARFRAAWQSGEAADPRPFLDQASETDRRELQALIDGFLARAPGDPDEPGAFAAFRQAPEHVRLRAAIDARSAESWPTLLPALRKDARMTRAALVSRLAAALGVSEREQKVEAYYHEMETGKLEPGGVSDRVLEALAALVGASAERLRAAGAAAVQPPPAAGAVFARTAAPDAAGAPPAPARAPERERDEVDELFTGGRGGPSRP